MAEPLNLSKNILLVIIAGVIAIITWSTSQILAQKDGINTNNTAVVLAKAKIDTNTINIDKNSDKMNKIHNKLDIIIEKMGSLHSNQAVIMEGLKTNNRRLDKLERSTTE